MGAALEVLPALLGLGYSRGEPILNFPAETNDGPPAELYHVDLPFVQAGDLLLQTTRPPLDDPFAGGRKHIERVYTDLEENLFKVWRGYFKTCERLWVQLHPDISARMNPGFEDRRSVKFYEKHGAPYRQLNAGGHRGWKSVEAEGRTAAFLLREREAWKGGPGLVGAFGMDGVSTLVWCYRLARDFAHLLQEPGFVMVELQAKPMPARVTDLRWASDWPIDIALHWRP